MSAFNNRNEEVLDWGKSMYGGWYANIRTPQGEYTGVRENKLTNLAVKVGLSVTVLRRDVHRLDN